MLLSISSVASFILIWNQEQESEQQRDLSPPVLPGLGLLGPEERSYTRLVRKFMCPEQGIHTDQGIYNGTSLEQLYLMLFKVLE